MFEFSENIVFIHFAASSEDQFDIDGYSEILQDLIDLIMTYFAQIKNIIVSNQELTFSIPNIISVSREYFINTFCSI